MAKQAQFGGSHTEKKLETVTRYLQAYQTVMKKQRLSTVFFDAFAGTGDLPFQTVAPGLFGGEIDGDAFIEGSARRALRIDPPFDHYVFVEKMKGKATELLQLRTEFGALASRIKIINGDANDALIKFCKETRWRKTRAVVFLDPFGNQVPFATIEAVARCNIDLWYLFPAGLGVNRQIGNYGGVVDSAEQSLDNLYGTRDWRDALVRHETVRDLFGESEISVKQAGADNATRYMIQRMATIFDARVLDSWLPLGRHGSHWYSLLFACGNPNPRAWEIGSRIARAVMNRK
jgi:three-Cys-motif partner protein